MNIWNPAAIPPKQTPPMKTIKFALAMLLLAVGFASAAFLVWWSYTVVVLSVEWTPDKWRTAIYQFLFFAVIALACVLGGAALLQSARGPAPFRKRFDRFTVKNILIVAYPQGCELLEFIESEPDAATEILDGVFFERRERVIYIRAMGLVKQPNDETDGKVYAAISQARQIYP